MRRSRNFYLKLSDYQTFAVYFSRSLQCFRGIPPCWPCSTGFRAARVERRTRIGQGLRRTCWRLTEAGIPWKGCRCTSALRSSRGCQSRSACDSITSRVLAFHCEILCYLPTHHPWFRLGGVLGLETLEIALRAFSQKKWDVMN